jgi:sRNA-binding carbon storage regulator CsrA
MKVTVLGVKGSRVKLGFEVDPSVPVHRGEIWDRINVSERLNNPTEDLGMPIT